MEIRYKKELYSKKVLFQACYRLTDYAYIHLDCDGLDYIVSIRAKDSNDVRDFAALFSNQIIEESAREKLDMYLPNERVYVNQE